ncbi:MAG: hypothetical protein NTV33_10775, partial [Coprothermobacterota bacterium]|nr:hypothetical protein [Coprothermobacterota bacterium]
GSPYPAPIFWGTALARKDSLVVSLDQATANGWLQGVLFRYNGSSYDLLYSGGTFQAMAGYWVRSLQTGVTLLFPNAQPPPPPPVQMRP